MTIQILTDKNLVIIDNISIEIDCSRFKKEFKFSEINPTTRWIEKEPFKGREKLKDWSKIDNFINEVKVILNKKANKPNTYSIWNETIQDETISSHIHRRIEKGTATWFDKKLCCLLKKIEDNHCAKSIGE